jgi:hypothetical protein
VGTYDLIVTLLVGAEATFLAGKAVFEMNCELGLTCVSLLALRTGHSEIARLRMMVEFGLTLEDKLAADALEVIALEVDVQLRLTRAVEVATRLHAVLMS